jgi:Rha family phage regulatory protein
MTDLNIVPIRKDNLVNITKDGRPVTTSLKIAEKFGKEHRNVTQSIENLECPDEFGLLNFQQTSYIDQWNRKQKMYLITRDGFAILAMGFTGKKAMEWKLKYIAAFNAMEKRLYDRSATRLSQDDSDAISYLLSSVDTIQRNMAKLTELRKYEDNPVAPFCDDQCIYKAGGFILKDDIYTRYESWCYIKEEYALTKPVFFRKLYKYASFVRSVKRIIKGKTSYGITGFRLKEAEYGN